MSPAFLSYYVVLLLIYIYTHTHTHTGTYDIKSNIICIFFQTARVVVLWESINEKTDLHRRNFYRRSRHPGVAFFLKKECIEGADIQIMRPAHTHTHTHTHVILWRSQGLSTNYIVWTYVCMYLCIYTRTRMHTHCTWA